MRTFRRLQQNRLFRLAVYLLIALFIPGTMSVPNAKDEFESGAAVGARFALTVKTAVLWQSSFYNSPLHRSRVYTALKAQPVTTLVLLEHNSEMAMMFGIDYKKRANGNWPIASGWTTGGTCGSSAAAAYPVAGDTVSDDCGFTTTIDGTSEFVGASGASGTIAFKLYTQGTLTIINGGSLDLTGDLDWKAGTINVGTTGAGTITLDTPNTVTTPGYRAITRFGSGNTTQLNCGNGGWTNPGVLNTAGTGPHGFWDLGKTTAAGQPGINFQKCKLQNLGDTTQNIGLKREGCNHNTGGGGGSCNNTVIDGLLITGSAGIEFTYGGGDGKQIFTIADMHIRTPIYTNNADAIFYLGDNTTLVSPGVRTFQTSTAYNNSRNQLKMRFDTIGFTYGVINGRRCTTFGLRWYNLSISGTAGGQQNLWQCSTPLVDLDLGTAMMTASADSGTTFRQILGLWHDDNIHPWQVTGSLSGAKNVYRDNVFNGDDFTASDTSDVINDEGDHDTIFNLFIDRAGTLEDDLNVPVSGKGTNFLNNTVHNDYALDLGETATSTATKFRMARNNIFDRPAPEKCWGLLWATNLVNDVRQSAFDWENNLFYGFPGSGDTGATTGCTAIPPANLTHQGLGVIGPIAYPIKQIVAGCTASASASTVRAVSASCNATGAQVGDYVRITSNGHSGQNNFGWITALAAASPFDATVTTIATLQSGDTFEVTKNYWANGCIYGATLGCGLNDIHLDPVFKNPNARTCPYWQSLGGTCSDAARGKHVAGASSNTTTINCVGCFSGITANVDVVKVEVCTTTCAERGISTVTVVSANQITISPAISGTTSGDIFSFITATQGLARCMVSAGGWDYLGNATTARTDCNENAGFDYFRDAYTPTAAGALHYGMMAPTSMTGSTFSGVTIK